MPTNRKRMTDMETTLGNLVSRFDGFEKRINENLRIISKHDFKNTSDIIEIKSKLDSIFQVKDHLKGSIKQEILDGIKNDLHKTYMIDDDHQKHIDLYESYTDDLNKAEYVGYIECLKGIIRESEKDAKLLLFIIISIICFILIAGFFV